MKIRHTTWITALSFGLLLALSGCYPRCECNGHGGCFEGMCECEEGYMGDNCEFVTGEHLAGDYAAVSISQNDDTLSFNCSMIANANDITALSLTNFHGISTVQGVFRGAIFFEGLGGNWRIPSQPLGTGATISGYGEHIANNDNLVMTYTIIAASDTLLWTATFTH